MIWWWRRNWAMVAALVLADMVLVGAAAWIAGF